MVATSETSQLIDLLQSHPEVGPNLAYVQRIPPKEAVKASFPEDLPEGIISTLQSRGIEQPYFHQADCLKDSQAGKHTVVVTPAVFFFANFPRFLCKLRSFPAKEERRELAQEGSSRRSFLA